ncbi:MAG: choice-of-anchor D domain-containing protein, partial [Gemmatimonadales bacterium]
GGGAEFTRNAPACLTAPIAPAGNCVVAITYTPTAAGAHSGTLTITSDAPGSPHTVAISGTGTVGGVSLTPSPLAFGGVAVGANASLNVTITNTGGASLTVSSVTAAGAAFSQASPCVGVIPPAGTCVVAVTFTPPSAGPHAGTLTVASDAPGSPHGVNLSGTGLAPALGLSSTSLDFGNQTQGTQSAPQSVTVTNTGTAQLDISSVTVTGDFGFLGCPTPLSLAPAASCTLSIKFLPTAVGTRNGGISIASNAGGSPHAIALTGNGTPVPVPGITLAPSSAAFGTIVVGSSSTQVLVLSNPGTAPLAITSIAASGAGFSQTNACPGSLAPSAACNINVTFAPGVAGPASGQLDVVSNAAPSPLTAALSGTGQPATVPGLALSPTGITFPPQFVGTTSAPKTVTLTSSGTAPLVISQVTVSGDFSFSGCGPSTLAPNATCTFSINFRPQSVGGLSGSIVVTSNAPGSPHTIALQGNGASLSAPEIVMSPSAFAFGTLRTTTSATIAGRLNNTGAATLAISQIQATGSFFSQSNNCPASIPVGGFCDVTVTYAPGAVGAHSGQLVIHANTIPSPVVIALSGSGVDQPPAFLVPGGPVVFGQSVVNTTSRRTLVLTNTGGEPLVVGSLSILGSDAFAIEGACGTIAPAASCSLTVVFRPTAIANFVARLDIVSNHSGGVVQVALSGQGTPVPQPDLQFSSSALGYGDTMILSINPQIQRVTLTNAGTAPVTISAVRSTTLDFIVPPGLCVGTMAPGVQCFITVSFRPVASGPRAGSLVVDSTPAQSDSVSLVGRGCRPYVPGRTRSSLCSP